MKKQYNEDGWCFVVDRVIPEDEIIDSLPLKYEMNLNKTDMMIVLKALHEYGLDDAKLLLRDIFRSINIIE